MNVLILNPILYTPPSSGGKIQKVKSIKNTMIYNYALGFEKAGHNVTLVAAEDYKPILEEKYEFKIIFLRSAFKKRFPNFPNGFPILRGLWGYLKKNKHFDIVISSDIFTYQSFAASIICPEKLVIWHEVGGHLPSHKIPSKLWYNIIVRLFIKNRILIVPRSDTAKNFVERYCNIVSDITIDNCVIAENFTFSADKEPYFIVMASLIKRKNVRKIIEVYYAFIEKYKMNYKLLIAGEGPEKENLILLIDKLNLNNQIQLMGFMPHNNLAPVLSKASGLLAYSLHELNMVSITEAIVCGTPVLTNMTPYLASFVKSQNLGIAKADWDEDDLFEFTQNTQQYVNNCAKIRHTLSNTYLSDKMLEIFNNFKSSK